MFHIGKVLEVLSSEDKGAKASEKGVYALLEMWDENMVVFKANAGIGRELKENDFVLVDYTPVAVGGSPVPRQEIAVILGEAKGKKAWAKLKEYIEHRKRQRSSASDSTSQNFGQGKMIG